MTGDEQRVVDGLQKGEIWAFHELVELYKKKVYYLALDMTGNHHDAEDTSQEVFMKAFSAMKSFRGDAKLSSWLHRITVNACIDRTRKRPLQLVELDAKENFDVVASDRNPEEIVQEKSMQGVINTALNTLPPQQKSIFILRHYNDLMLREIAEVLQISEGTVKAQLFRAIRKLQKQLAPFRQKRRSVSNE
jgi:RNA polymerase sigma-70 factor (ECF subfamily)